MKTQARTDLASKGLDIFTSLQNREIHAMIVIILAKEI